MKGIPIDQLPPEVRAQLNLPAKQKRTTQRHVGIREAKSQWICMGVAAGGCGEDDEQCPESERRCGHHCNCSWVHDHCHWCGKEWGET